MIETESGDDIRTMDDGLRWVVMSKVKESLPGEAVKEYLYWTFLSITQDAESTKEYVKIWRKTNTVKTFILLLERMISVGHPRHAIIDVIVEILTVSQQRR